MPQLLAHSEIAVADLDSATVYYGIETDKNASFETRFKQCSEQLLKKFHAFENPRHEFQDYTRYPA